MMQLTGRTVQKEGLGKTWTVDSFGHVTEGPFRYAPIYEIDPDVNQRYYVNISDVTNLDEIPVYSEFTLTVSDGQLVAEGI